MRAHTITTKPPVGGRARAKRTIAPGGGLALSVAVSVAGLMLVVGLASAGAHTLSKSEARHETGPVARDSCERWRNCVSYEVTVCSRWGRVDSGRNHTERHHAKCEFTLYLRSRTGYRGRCRRILGWWLDAGSDEIKGPKKIRLFESGRQGCVDGW
jgi:hypothetical protein